MKRIATFRCRLLVLIASIALVMLSAAGAAASQAGFVYTLRAGSGPSQIFGYSLDPITGTLVSLPGFPIASGGSTQSGFIEQMAYANGRLYVLNGSVATISVFTVNPSTGALTHLPFSPFFIGGDSWDCVAVHPSGSPVIVGNPFSQLASFVVTPTTITAASGRPFATGAARPFSCTFSRDMNFVYAGGFSGNSIAGFSVNAGTGVLTPLQWDVLWRNRMTGQNIVWLMNGLSVEMAAFLPTIADTNWDMVAVGDVSADGKADVLLRNRMTGQNIGWLMNGTVVSVSAFLPTIADTNWEIKGIGDVTVDLMADVVWRNRATGQNIGWQMNGLTVSSAAFLPTIADTNWEIVGK